MGNPKGHVSASVVVLAILLLVSLMACVFFISSTFVYYRKWEEQLAFAQHQRKEHEQATELVQSLSFWLMYMKHVSGAHTLPEAELSIVVPSVQGDSEMAIIHATFEADMELVNEVLQRDEPIPGYHQAVVALAKRLQNE